MTVRLRTPEGRWTVAAAVLGSGAVFVESTVVNVALPTLADDLGLGMAGVQWVVNGYLLTLSALILFGGALGDVVRRRSVFAVGLVGFAISSLLCAFAPGLGSLVVFRLLQGAAGALLVPNSLAILDTAFEGEERGSAIGQWAGWSGISTALGPLAGGLVIDLLSWRWVFAGAAPFALAAAWIVLRRVPRIEEEETRASVADLDHSGAGLVTLGLAGLTAALILGPEVGFGRPLVWGGASLGIALLVGFAFVEVRAERPLFPPALLRNRQFTGTNGATLLLYTALSALFFLLVLQLQNVLGYSAFEAGAALLPVNLLLLTLSPVAGRIGERIGAQWPIGVGSLIAGGGMLLLVGVRSGVGYVEGVLPGIAVFGFGLSLVVAPLTAAVLGSVEDDRTGVASGVNNAVARFAGLVATAFVPAMVGLGGLEDLSGEAFVRGFERAMLLGAGLCVAAAAVTFVTVRRAAPVESRRHPAPSHGCAQRTADGRPVAAVGSQRNGGSGPSQARST